MLSDIAASAGATDNVFSMLAQYSTTNGRRRPVGSRRDRSGARADAALPRSLPDQPVDRGRHESGESHVRADRDGAEVLTDPLVADSLIAWYGSSGSINEQGEIGDMCATGAGDEGTNTFNGHAYTVQKVWDQLAAACVVSDSRYQPPSADFSATPSGAQASLAANASSSNADHGIASYAWSFGDGSTGSGASPTHAYAAGGAYTVSLTATDDLGFTAHATHQVTVSSPPPPPPPPGSGSGGGTSSPAPSPPAIKLAAQASSTALTSGSSLVVPLGSVVTCPAGATCTVTVTLTVPSTPTRGHRHSKPIVIGTATYRITGGRSTPKVKLNARGVALLRRRHSLHATTSVKVSGSGTTLTRRGKLVIHSPAKKRKHR